MIDTVAAYRKYDESKKYMCVRIQCENKIRSRISTLCLRFPHLTAIKEYCHVLFIDKKSEIKRCVRLQVPDNVMTNRD